MDKEAIDRLDKNDSALFYQLNHLSNSLRDYTKQKYNRINPFCENLFDWKDKGNYVTENKSGVTIYDSTTIVGDVIIGDNTWIGPFCSLDGTAGLHIGKYCSISLGCQVLTHDTAKWALSGGKQSYEYEGTKIGNCCFLGSYVVVLKGITIGDHSLIAAGSVVVENVKPYSIMGGVPAKKIGDVMIGEDGKVSFIY